MNSYPEILFGIAEFSLACIFGREVRRIQGKTRQKLQITRFNATIVSRGGIIIYIHNLSYLHTPHRTAAQVIYPFLILF